MPEIKKMFKGKSTPEEKQLRNVDDEEWEFEQVGRQSWSTAVHSCQPQLIFV